MNQETLRPIIEAVVREVIRKMEKETGIIGSQEEQKVQKEKLLLVFTGGTGNLDVVLAQLKTLSNKYCFDAIFTSAAEKAIGRKRVQQDIELENILNENLYDALSKTNTVIFPTLTQNTAAKAAIGIRDSVATEALACGLLLKKRVIAVTDSVPLKSMPATYARMVGEILKRVEQLGVDMCKAEELVDKVLYIKKDDNAVKTVSTCIECESEISVGPDKPIQANAFILEDKAPVTAEVIYKAISAGLKRIILPPKTIVTPMAQDTARDNKIIIEWAVK